MVPQTPTAPKKRKLDLLQEKIAALEQQVKKQTSSPVTPSAAASSRRKATPARALVATAETSKKKPAAAKAPAKQAAKKKDGGKGKGKKGGASDYTVEFERRPNQDAVDNSLPMGLSSKTFGIGASYCVYASGLCEKC